MSEEVLENSPQDEENASSSRLVPVSESIKYRRRAQQAESKLQQLEQKLEDLQTQFDNRNEQLATAESHRDEIASQMEELENRTEAERRLFQAGVVDIETASMLLSKKMNFTGPIDTEGLSHNIEQLLLEKPFLRANSGTITSSLPSSTASAKPSQHGSASRLACAAQKAVKTGCRKDIAEYLRLRRVSTNQ